MTPDMYLTEQLAKFSDWLIMRDILIPADDRTMHIDFLIVSPYCIFPGEMKTYRGVITGKGIRKYWKQYTDGIEIDYFSPIIQNILHIRYLKKFLQHIPYELHFHGIAVMEAVGSGSVQIQPPYPPDSSIVTSFQSLRNVTQSICERRQMNLTFDEAQFLYDYIGKNQLRGDEIRLRHTQEAKEYKLHARKALMRQICPECGAPLTMQASPSGNYWICSQYPKCDYMHKM